MRPRPLPEHSKPATTSSLPMAFELVERQRLRTLDQAGDLQAERRRIDRGMAVVLRREELILRRERAVDLADVEDAHDLARVRGEVRRDVGERHERLALREHRHRPFGNARTPQAGGREAALETRRRRLVTFCVPYHAPCFGTTNWKA